MTIEELVVENDKLKRQLAYESTALTMMKADYKARLKDDLVAMLTEIQLEIEEEAFDMTGLVYIPNTDNANVILMDDLNKIIQQKINALKGEV